MHIAEGVLSVPVLAAGTALAAGGVAIGLRKLDYDRVPQVAVLTSAFFVASLVHVPVGPSSVHLVLGGLVGIILGWAAFPAMLVALFLQTILFQFGGLTALGVNTLNVALPAVVCYGLFGPLVRGARPAVATSAGFAAGATAVALTCAMVALSLVGTQQSFLEPAIALVVAHVPVMVVEGAITAAVVGSLRQVRPDLLRAPLVEVSVRG